jgi:hypothetical protein
MKGFLPKVDSLHTFSSHSAVTQNIHAMEESSCNFLRSSCPKKPNVIAQQLYSYKTQRQKEGGREGMEIVYFLEQNKNETSSS